MTEPKIIHTPVSDETIRMLRAGDICSITGTIYTARDAAHKRMAETLEQNGETPFPFHGQIVYYAGPCPNRPGQVIGSIGPTTSGRMDAYTPLLIAAGLKVMVGKGLRNENVRKAVMEHGGVYFAAIGGAGALLSQTVKKSELIAFEDLGTEAIRRLEVENFPVVVALDCSGNDIYRNDIPIEGA